MYVFISKTVSTHGKTYRKDSNRNGNKIYFPKQFEFVVYKIKIILQNLKILGDDISLKYLHD